MGKMVVKVILKIPVKDGHGYVFSTMWDVKSWLFYKSWLFMLQTRKQQVFFPPWNFKKEKQIVCHGCQAWILIYSILRGVFANRSDKAGGGKYALFFQCIFSWRSPFRLPRPCRAVFSLHKSRTVGRTRCDCFHTQEVITPDLPQLWLRLINIHEQLMRCQAGTRPFPSCLWRHQWRGKMTSTLQCHDRLS